MNTLKKHSLSRTLLASISTLCIMFSAYTVYSSTQAVKCFDLTLTNIEAVAQGEGGEWGCGGNPTWIKDQALKCAQCWNGGTHKVCKSETGVCCNPAEGTDCKPLL